MSEEYETFEHDADIGVRGYGKSLAEAFANAARALISVITDPRLVVPRVEITLNLEAEDPELLFYDWLNAVIYEIATRRMLFADFEVGIEDGRLAAVLRGERVDPLRHQPAVEPKGATMTELQVGRRGDRWVAQCVVDV